MSATGTGFGSGSGSGVRLRLTGHHPSAYREHPLHAGARTYGETNCYSDVIIELLHAQGLEPLAAFGHLARMDFEGDQWTFFKPPAEDLERLFGVDIHEMQPYRPLPVQIAEQLAAGRTLIVELDAWYLPDTASTSYRTEHVKTSVAAEAIDPEAQLLRYFHGPGLFELRDEDYRGIFRLDGCAPEILPPYTELVRFDAGAPSEGEELRALARELLLAHLARRPDTNPFERFAVQLVEALPGLLEAGLEDYHAYAFATVRMAGSGFELAASHAEWLLGEEGAAPVIAPLRELVEGCKALSFRLARRKPFASEAILEPLAAAWSSAMSALEGAAG